MANPGGAGVFKRPLNWLKFTKKSWGQAPKTSGFGILDLPLKYVSTAIQLIPTAGVEISAIPWLIKNGRDNQSV